MKNKYSSQLAKLEAKLNDPDLHKKQRDISSLYEEYAQVKELHRLTELIAQLKREQEENHSLLKNEKDDELVRLLQEDTKQIGENLKKAQQELELLERPVDPNDKRDVLLEIRAGTGGEEAALFAADLFRMYTRFAESQGWKVALINTNQSANNGFKEVIAEISGKNVYQHLKHESGVHRVQRIPVTESSGRIHTSAASVVVLPVVEDLEVEVNPNDLRIDVYRSSGPGGQSVNTTDSAVRITHIPTGIIVSCQDGKSQLKNRDKAMQVLRSRLFDLRQQERSEKISNTRQEAIKTGDRSAKIRTYNFPQSRVTDHRIKVTWHNLDDILNGKLNEIIDELSKTP